MKQTLEQLLEESETTETLAKEKAEKEAQAKRLIEVGEMTLKAVEKMAEKEPVVIENKEISIPEFPKSVRIENPVDEVSIKKPTWFSWPDLSSLFNRIFSVKLEKGDKESPQYVVLVDEDGNLFNPEKENKKVGFGGLGTGRKRIFSAILDSNGTWINPASEATLKNIAGFNIPSYTSQTLSRDTNGILQSVAYKSGATTVATLTFGRDGSNRITSITKS